MREVAVGGQRKKTGLQYQPKWQPEPIQWGALGLKRPNRVALHWPKVAVPVSSCRCQLLDGGHFRKRWPLTRCFLWGPDPAMAWSWRLSAHSTPCSWGNDPSLREDWVCMAKDRHVSPPGLVRLPTRLLSQLRPSGWILPHPHRPCFCLFTDSSYSTYHGISQGLHPKFFPSFADW